MRRKLERYLHNRNARSVRVTPKARAGKEARHAPCELRVTPSSEFHIRSAVTRAVE